MCAAASAWAQVGRIVYGAADPKRGYSKFTPSLLHPKAEVGPGSGGRVRKHCHGILQEEKEFDKI